MTTEFSTELTTLGSEGRPSGGPPPVRGINIKRLIRLQLLPMMIIATVIAVPTVALVWLLVPVTYSASAQILYQVDTATLIDEDVMNRDQLGRYMNDQVNLMTSATVMSRVAKNQDVMRVPWVAAATDWTALRDVVSARILPNSNMINISVTTDSRDHALTIIRSVVDEYYDEVYTKEGLEVTETLSLLKAERQKKQTELQEKERDISAMTSSLGAPLSDGGSGMSATMQSYYDNLAAATSDLTTAKSELGLAERELESARQYLEDAKTSPGEPIYAFNVETQVSQAQNVIYLESRIAEVEGELATLERTYQPDAPQLESRKKNLDSYKRKLRETMQAERLEVISAVVARQEELVSSIQSRVSDAEERQQRFQELIDQNEDTEIKISQDRYLIAQLERERDDLRDGIERLNGQIDDIMLKSQAPARLQLLDDVEASNKPNHGDRIKLSLLCMIAACGAAGAFGLLREFTDQTVRTAQDLSYVTSVPLLASIPHTSDDRLPTEANATTLAADHAVSVTADEFRRILTRIIYPPEGAAELNTCLIVSPSRGDGKTSMAANLAIALAQANRRVLLLDISARHPSIERCFDMEPGEGLSEVLVERVNPAELVRSGDLQNLHIMGPGFLREALVGKLASREIVDFLERAEEEYEHVIIDTPPALLMSDAKLLAPIVDGVIVVCGVGKSSLGMLRRCIGDLQNIGANVVGIVLNGIRAQRGGYMRRNVQLYYEYPEGRGELGRRGGKAAAGRAASNGNGMFPAEPSAEETEELPMIVVVDHPQGSDEADPKADA